MGKLRLSTHRKNEKRHKYGFFPVRIPLNDAISVLKVSIPLDLLSFGVPTPATAISESPAVSLSTLQTRISVLGILPKGQYWFAGYGFQDFYLLNMLLYHFGRMGGRDRSR